MPWGLLSWQCACLSFRSNLSHFKRSCLGNVVDAYFLNIFVLHTQEGLAIKAERMKKKLTGGKKKVEIDEIKVGSSQVPQLS